MPVSGGIRRRYCSPLGTITLAGTQTALTGLCFDGQAHFARTLSKGALEGMTPAMEQAVRWLDDYFSGNIPNAPPDLAPSGTPFQLRVWKSLLTIPYGQTVTYGQLAGQLDSSPRAIGAAVGRNPISLLIPCHRVVGSQNRLTGYAGGLDRKQYLLTLEQKRRLP